MMQIGYAFTFEAAHRLPKVAPTHRCYRMHGHTYRVELILDGDVDEATGFVIDFFEIEEAIKPIFNALDHSTLNDEIENPTAENISSWIFDRCEGALKPLVAVRVFETPFCWAECREPNVHQILSEIIRYNLLEDRLEYGVDDLKSAYGLTQNKAESLWRMIQEAP